VHGRAAFEGGEEAAELKKTKGGHTVLSLCSVGVYAMRERLSSSNTQREAWVGYSREETEAAELKKQKEDTLCSACVVHLRQRYRCCCLWRRRALSTGGHSAS